MAHGIFPAEISNIYNPNMRILSLLFGKNYVFLSLFNLVFVNKLFTLYILQILEVNQEPAPKI